VGGRRSVVLWVDVTPKPNIHVYARGAKGFDAVKLTVVPQAGVAVRPAKYPAAQTMASPGTLDRVPVYGKTFRIAQPLTLAKGMKSGEAMAVTGALTYQACDDRLCYPTQTIAIRWSLVNNQQLQKSSDRGVTPEHAEARGQAADHEGDASRHGVMRAEARQRPAE
jgi:thiol:disulfide interchange protein